MKYLPRRSAEIRGDFRGGLDRTTSQAQIPISRIHGFPDNFGHQIWRAPLCISGTPRKPPKISHTIFVRKTNTKYSGPNVAHGCGWLGTTHIADGVWVRAHRCQHRASTQDSPQSAPEGFWDIWPRASAQPQPILKFWLPFFCLH